MTCNLKSVALTLVAMLAMSAVVASAASAQTNGKLTSTGGVPITLTAEEIGVAKNFLKAFGVTIECAGSTYTGHLVGSKTNPIPSGSSEATLTPHYKEVDGAGTANCNASNGTSVTVDMNGCDFVVHLGQTTGEVDEYGATVDVVCPAGQQITLTFFGSHGHAQLVCRGDIPPQNGLAGADAVDTNTADGHIELTGTVKNITLTKTATGVFCPEETSNTAEFSIDVTVKAHNAVGSQEGVSLSHATVGELTSADGVAVTLTGSETGVGKNFLKMFGTTIECPGSTYTGHLVGSTTSLIPSGSSTITLTPHHKQVDGAGTANCNASNGTSVTVDMNGCDYVLHLGETTGGADEYGATFDIVCPAGQQITLTFFTAHTHAVLVCRSDIPPQNGLAGADAVDTNTADGHIELTGTVKNITLTKTATGVFCPEETSNTAEFSIDVTVKAHNAGGGPVAITLSH